MHRHDIHRGELSSAKGPHPSTSKKLARARSRVDLAASQVCASNHHLRVRSYERHPSLTPVITIQALQRHPHYRYHITRQPSDAASIRIQFLRDRLIHNVMKVLKNTPQPQQFFPHPVLIYWVFISWSCSTFSTCGWDDRVDT